MVVGWIRFKNYKNAIVDELCMTDGLGGWLHKGKVLAPLMFVVLYENLSTLFLFRAITYLKKI